MNDMRKYKRFHVKLEARYLLGAGSKEWKACTVVNVSRGGMGVEVYLQEKVKIGSQLSIDIIIPTLDKSIKAQGVLRWIKELRQEQNYLGGVEFTEIGSDEKWKLLDYAYDNWSGEEAE